MNEAELCDRISLMHAGKVLISDTPKAITASRNAATLEDAFIAYLEEAIGETAPEKAVQEAVKIQPEKVEKSTTARAGWLPNPRRMLAFSRREALELKRDPIRATLAILGTVILMFVIGYGINLDVEDLTFAVLDRDDTTISRDYTQQLAGSRYFTEKHPLPIMTTLIGVCAKVKSARQLRSRRISAAMSRVVVPSKLVPDRWRHADASGNRAWLRSGNACQLADTKARELYGSNATVGNFNLEIRYRYNPDVQSLVAMVPAVIPLLLLMIPAMLAVLSVVREKNLAPS